MISINPFLVITDEESLSDCKPEFWVYVSSATDDGDLAIARTEAAAWRKAARVLRKLAKEADTLAIKAEK